MTDSSVARIYGPPGTGKTRTLSGRVASTVLERGVDAVRIASFSNTAATEIANRPGVSGVLPKGAVGTLHSHAFHFIEQPDVALDPKVIREWNDRCGTDWRVSADGRKMTDRGIGGGGDDLCTGDALLSALGVLRARQIPPAQWPLAVQRFARSWTEWKRGRGNNTVDFEDMIVQAYQRAERGESMPGKPSVLVVDEAQDMTPIECALAFAWGRLLGSDGRLVFALDDDQAIFNFRGGDPSMILEADASDEVLAQSYRVPPAVHAVAQHWIGQCSSRVQKSYRPRQPHSEHDLTEEHSRGWAYRVDYGLSDPRLVAAIEADVDAGRSVMVLASCGYMLTGLIGLLRARGVPFHNPYRPSEGAWNPLGKPGRGISSAEKVYRYLALDDRLMGADARLWTGDDIRAWTDLISFTRAAMTRGAQRAIDALATGEVPPEHLSSLFREDASGDDALTRATAGADPASDHLEWLASVIVESKRKVTAYPIQVARSQGASALVETPLVTVGTVHSAKGGEASVVYLSPEMSAAGMRQWQGAATTRDQTRRLLYVGITRAFHRLVMLAPSAGASHALSPADVIPSELEVSP